LPYKPAPFYSLLCDYEYGVGGVALDAPVTVDAAHAAHHQTEPAIVGQNDPDTLPRMVALQVHKTVLTRKVVAALFIAWVLGRVCNIRLVWNMKYLPTIYK